MHRFKGAEAKAILETLNRLNLSGRDTIATIIAMSRTSIMLPRTSTDRRLRLDYISFAMVKSPSMALKPF